MARHFVKDPYVRYVDAEVTRLKKDLDTISYFELCKIVKNGLGFNTVMLIYFHEPGTVGLQNNLRVIYDDTSTIAMFYFWVKFKDIDLYVEHEVDNPIIVDRIFLLTTREGDVERVKVDREGDDERVESDCECDMEKVESSGEGDIREVQVDEEGVFTTGIEVDEYISMESGGHISLGFTVGEDNDSEVATDEYASDFATSHGVDNVADKYAGDFATSDEVDNVVTASSGEEEDRNKTEMKNMKMVSEGGASFPYTMNKMVIAAMIAQHFKAIIKDHPKMKLRESQRRCAFEMYVNVTVDYCYRVKKIVK
ncbi:hypothetical protein J1N35_014711 [Gossypium stocksii]|uniref:PB1-like domain-containing protein n=1 Tax=Gossypium stocksii TaxID=47602 RepID=A0A9D4A971_9ROSI|nr:hypothetical protein J1N35_014711 [Gossypium stocksii]